jgi:hypothetical protein
MARYPVAPVPGFTGLASETAFWLFLSIVPLAAVAGLSRAELRRDQDHRRGQLSESRDPRSAFSDPVRLGVDVFAHGFEFDRHRHVDLRHPIGRDDLDVWTIVPSRERANLATSFLSIEPCLRAVRESA